MPWTSHFLTFLLGASLLSPRLPALQSHKPTPSAAASAPLLWSDPGAGRNLYYGPGGKDHLPQGNYRFVDEDMDGTGPKFEVVDDRGVRWKVKLGGEVKSETAATRLVWGLGYFVNEDYYLPEIHVSGLPKLKRGQELVSPGGIVRDVRLKRRPETEKDIGHWSWFENPFIGSREFDGLKITMALLNNWDLKNANNRIYSGSDGEVRYVVSDLGECLGDPVAQTRGEYRTYGRAEFIAGVDADTVTFFVPNLPPWPVRLLNFRIYRSHRTMEQIFQRVPRAHAKWIGGLLGNLSPDQIRDCFRAAGYSPAEVEGFTKVLLERIARLKAL